MTELDKLRNMLDKAKIPYESIQDDRMDVSDADVEMYGEVAKWERNQVIYGGSKSMAWYWDGICQYGSYGAGLGMIETYGYIGWDKNHAPQVMTAKEAFDVIAADWKERMTK